MNKFNLKFAAQEMTKEQMKNVKGGEAPNCTAACWYGDDDSPAGDVVGLSSCDTSYIYAWCEYYWGDSPSQVNCSCGS